MLDSFNDNNAGKIALLKWRNHEGKNALFLAVEHKQEDVAKYIIETFPDTDLSMQDARLGNTILHYACINDNIELVKLIFEKQP